MIIGILQGGDVRITLDGRGNLIEETEEGATQKSSRRFEYNANNRPIRFSKNGKLSAQYHYNAHGLRDRKTLINGQQAQTTRFTYAPDTRLLSANTQAQTTHYVWLGAAPIAQIEKAARTTTTSAQPAQITYLHTDHLLTPRVATNEQQKIVWRWQSDAFGETPAESDPDKDGRRAQIQLRFPGQYADDESGLYYNVFRYYDPKSGRYTQSDPIGLGGGLNGFEYAFSNSLANVDVLGLLVTAVYDKTTGKITVTDNDDPTKTATVDGFSGKPANNWAPAPNGQYYISNWGGLTPHYYALIHKDARLDDYVDGYPSNTDPGTTLANIRFHCGFASHGCVTSPGACGDHEGWKKIEEILSSTKMGPDITFVNGERHLNYGNLTIQGDGWGSQPPNQLPPQLPPTEEVIVN